MQVPKEAMLLRIFIGESDRWHHHIAKILRLSIDLPTVIEIVDSEEKVNKFLPDLEQMIGGGLVTLEKAKVIHYRHRDSTKS